MIFDRFTLLPLPETNIAHSKMVVGKRSFFVGALPISRGCLRFVFPGGYLSENWHLRLPTIDFQAIFVNFLGNTIFRRSKFRTCFFDATFGNLLDPMRFAQTSALLHQLPIQNDRFLDDSRINIPSRELTYPTWGKGTSSSKVPFYRIC